MTIGDGVQRWHYAYAAWRISSELELPEWQVFRSEQPFVEPDVVIRLSVTRFDGNLLSISAEQCCFRVTDVADYCVRGGREIIISPAPNAGRREIRLYLLGTAWGALCYQRGILVLHASVVEHKDRAVAFCGPSAAGKSSLVAWLAARGHRLVCDDLCRFDVDREPPCVYPAAPRLKLWRDALAYFQWSNDGLERDHFRMDKFHLSPASSCFPEERVQEQTVDRCMPLPLRAIYLLEWGEPHIARLKGIAALRQLVESATYRGELLEPMGLTAAHWQRCAKLAQRVAIFEFTRPADWTRMDTAMAMLVEHWHEPF